MTSVDLRNGIERVLKVHESVTYTRTRMHDWGAEDIDTEFCTSCEDDDGFRIEFPCDVAKVALGLKQILASGEQE